MQNPFALLLIIGVVWGFPSQPAGRIVGGHNANIKNFPYQLALLDQRYQQFCGAALIASQWALTAAHCTSGTSYIPTAVRAGSSIKSRGGQVVKISGLAIHPNYNSQSTPNYDFALLQLIEPVSAKYGTPIPLPSANYPVSEGQVAVVSGWGALWDHGRSTEYLQVVQLPVVSYNVCKQIFSNYGLPLGDATFCAGTFNQWETSSSCNGDSGGPVAVNGRLAGVVSWGVQCSTSFAPAVFADVAHATNWIYRLIEGTWYLKQNTPRRKAQMQSHNQTQDQNLILD